MDMLATFGGIALLLFFALLGHPAGKAGGFRRWALLALPAALAMGGCFLAETAGAGILAGADLPTWLLFVLIAPILEELVRWLVVTSVSPVSPGEAVWCSGWMGVAETLLKSWFQPMALGVHVFRSLLVVPLHGLLGGMLRRGPKLLPVTILIHLSFNAGIIHGGGLGILLPACATAMACLGWMILTERGGERNKTQGDGSLIGDDCR